MKIFSLIIMTSFIVQSFSSKEVQQEISQKEAIELAEKFIIENGYTAEKAKASKIKFEILDKNINETLKRRYNTLQKKAFCVSKDNVWHIGFLSVGIKIEKLTKEQKNSNLQGRSVKVSLDGKSSEIAHKEPLFSFFTKL